MQSFFVKGNTDNQNCLIYIYIYPFFLVLLIIRYSKDSFVNFSVLIFKLVRTKHIYVVCAFFDIKMY